MWIWKRILQIARGYLVYLLALFDVPIDRFEKQRFQLRIAGSCEHDPPKKKILLISFAGSTFLVGGFPRAEFQTVLSWAAECCGVTDRTDYLFLVDPSVTFYLKKSGRSARRRSDKWDGWQELVEKINNLIAANQYDKVVAVGSSMGASAILALLGRFRCDAAVVFNPLVDLIHESRMGFWIAGRRLPRQIRAELPAIMAQQCRSARTKVIVHCSEGSPADVAQLGFLREAVASREGATGGGLEVDSVLHVVWHNTDVHVLPRELKKRNELLPLLVDALQSVLQGSLRYPSVASGISHK